MKPRLTRTARPAVAGAMPMIDLMPRGEVERRERAALTRRWAWGLVAALAVVALATGGTFLLGVTAGTRVVSEQLTTATLLDELADLSDISTAMQTRSELESFRSSAMSSDIAYTSFFTVILGALPEGALIAGFDLYPGGVPQTAEPETEIGLTGTVTFQTSTPIDVAPTIRAIRDLPGIMAADGIDLASVEVDDLQTYNYSIGITFDQSLYTNDYAGSQEGGE